MNYTAVDDVGTVINPMIVEGQLHGGIVQGVGQALFENCVYDDVSGQLLSGSFMDYCMPRADNLPRMTVATHSTPCTHTPMGVKGCGEVGTIGSPAAVDQCGGRCAVASRREPCRHAGVRQSHLAHHAKARRCRKPPNRSDRNESLRLSQAELRS